MSTDAATMTAELVLDTRHGVGESPVWLASEQALYWVDIPGQTLNRYTPADGVHSHWKTPEMVGCIAPHAAGGWVAAAESGLYHLRVELSAGGPGVPGRKQVLWNRLASVSHASPGMRFNDGRCDRQGRFLSGTMRMDMAAMPRDGVLYQYRGPGQGGGLRELMGDFCTPNGMAFSPDGRTMYLADSHRSVQTVWAFDYDTDTGTPSGRRVFVDMNPLPGRPDGAAVDSDGCYWVCGNDAGLVHRFTPDGRLDRSLAVPVKKPAMCAFGGADLATLFVTSIRPDGVDLSDQPLAGGLFALRPGVTGLAEPVFQPR